MTEMKTAAVLIALAALACSREPDRETLCRAIGETPAIALQPRDRVFWEKDCIEYRLRLNDPGEAAARRASLPASAPCVPLSAGMVWSGPCRQGNECSSCRCEKGQCVPSESSR